MKFFYYLWLFSLIVHAENYELKYLKDASSKPEGYGIHADIGYGSYLIEVDSSEMNLAIDYDILEFTLGSSYTYDSWSAGFYGKFLFDGLTSNMYVNGRSKLNNQTKIKKDEFVFYLNHTVKKREMDFFKLNLVYRYASLDAIDRYNSFYNYRNDFKYETDGWAFSLMYGIKLSEKDILLLSGGLVYSRAKIKIENFIEQELQDLFIDDTVDSIGYKIFMAYSRKLSNSLSLDVRFDGWQHDFKKLKVSSQVGDYLPFARLKEELYSSYMGFTWRF